MPTETESLACAEKLYRRAKLLARCGAAQSHVSTESVSCAFSTSGTAKQGCTTNSIGTRPGLPAAFSADTMTVSRYTSVGSPRGSNASRSFAGAVPPDGPVNASHGSPLARRAVQESVPGPAFITVRLSPFTAVLPTAAESRTWPGARASVATGGGGVVRFSTWVGGGRVRGAGRGRTGMSPRPGG